MPLPTLRNRLGEGGFVLSAWLATVDPHVHECFARAGFDALTLDVQHGLHDFTSIKAGIERAVLLGIPALVRLPIEDRALAARALDCGASGVIMPMIETVEDARLFVDAVRYPPLGRRSYGPTRAAQLHSYTDRNQYVPDARAQTLAFAMIETSSAVENLEAILAIDGLDGVFVGPSDLSIALSGDGTLDPNGDKAEAAITRISELTASAGKIAAIYALTTDDARRYRAKGYRYVCVGSDFGVITAGAAALASAARS